MPSWPFRIGVILAWITTFSALAQEELSLAIDPWCGTARVQWAAPNGDWIQIQGTDNLDDPTSWAPLLSAQAGGDFMSWCDSEARHRTRRFYRAIRLGGEPPILRPRNFRLIDQAGRSHELYYSFGDPKVKGYALIFSGNTCSNLIPVLPDLTALSPSLAQGLKIWIIAQPFGNNRSNLNAEATALNIPFPVLHDSSQIVSREYGITQVPEAVLLNANFELRYRGPVSELIETNVQTYLASAVQELLTAQPTSFKHVRSLGTDPDYHSQASLRYAEDVAPILQRKCVACHRDGGIGPWAMTNHSVIQFYADLIKEEVMSKRMPPWHADPSVGKFSNDSSLTPEESSTLLAWIDANAPRGEGPDPLATPLPPPAAWPLGPPDLIVKIPTQNLPAVGDIDYRYIEMVPALTKDQWLRAAVVRPGNARVVHHSLVFLGDTAASLGGLSGYFAGYVPGLDPSTYPDNAGKLLKKGQKITFQMHYISIGTPQTDQTELGLYFLPSAPQRSLQTKAAFNVFFQIPANNPEHVVTATFGTFPKESLLYEVSPHQHLRGKWFKYELELPGGKRQLLINIPKYLFSWQRLYRFETPIRVPAGSKLICTGAWDNSPQNVDNPNPNVPVLFGEQTYEEMFIGYFNYAEL